MRAQVDRLVEPLSGIARLLLGGDAELKVSSVVKVRLDGTRDIFLELEPAVFRIRGMPITTAITHQDGTVEEYGPLDPAPAWLARAINDPYVARALRLRDADGLS